MKRENNHSPLKYIFISLAILLAYSVYDCSERGKKQEIENQRSKVWAASPAGLDFQANMQSLIKETPVRSGTGKLFFKGNVCSNDCSGHIAGYEWASDYGMTNPDKCDESDSPSFTEGCKSAVEDIISENDGSSY